MAWYPFLGYGVFWIGLIVAIIIYIKKRKFYPLMYLISVALYIFTVGFVMDVFNFSRNQISLTLAFSAVLFIFLGRLITQSQKTIRVKISKPSGVKITAGIILPLAILVALTILSNSNIGLEIKFNSVESVSFNDLFVYSSGDYGRVVLAGLTIKNDFFLSRNIEVNMYKACFYSSETGAASNREVYLYYSPAAAQYRGDDFFSSSYDYTANNIQVKRNSQKEAELFMQKMYDYQGSQRNYYINYDKILLFKYDKNRYDYDFCSKVSKEDIKNAVSIELKNAIDTQPRLEPQQTPPFLPTR